MKNFIGIYDNVLDDNMCSSIISYFETSSNKELGTYGKTDIVDATKKDSVDLVCDLNNEIEEINFLYGGLGFGTERYVEEYPEVSNISSWNLYPLFNIQRYYPNQGYHVPHCESEGLLSNHRVLAWMYYLNTITDGGHTRFVSYDCDVQAVAGRLVIWPAHFTHIHHGVVSPTQTKYIATGWYVYS